MFGTFWSGGSKDICVVGDVLYQLLSIEGMTFRLYIATFFQHHLWKWISSIHTWNTHDLPLFQPIFIYEYASELFFYEFFCSPFNVFIQNLHFCKTFRSLKNTFIIFKQFPSKGFWFILLFWRWRFSNEFCINFAVRMLWVFVPETPCDCKGLCVFIYYRSSIVTGLWFGGWCNTCIMVCCVN